MEKSDILLSADLIPVLNAVPQGLHHVHLMGICGTGMSLRLEMMADRWHHTYQMPGGAWGFNLNPHNTNLALDPVIGSIDMDTEWEQGKGFCFESSSSLSSFAAQCSPAACRVASLKLSLANNFCRVR